MSIEEKIAQAKRKLQQREHQKILQENREKEVQSKVDFRRIVIVGQMFIEHFPIVLQLSPSKTEEETKCEFEQLDNFIKALAQCHYLYQEIEGQSQPY